jgi:hypothetical protein
MLILDVPIKRSIIRQVLYAISNVNEKEEEEHSVCF